MTLCRHPRRPRWPVPWTGQPGWPLPGSVWRACVAALTVSGMVIYKPVSILDILQQPQPVAGHGQPAPAAGGPIEDGPDQGEAGAPIYTGIGTPSSRLALSWPIRSIRSRRLVLGCGHFTASEVRDPASVRFHLDRDAGDSCQSDRRRCGAGAAGSHRVLALSARRRPAGIRRCDGMGHGWPGPC